MAISEKQRQKKLAKKNRKRKLTKSLLNIADQQKLSSSSYAGFPIHECFVPNTLFEIGIGYVIVTRKTPTGLIAISAFVVDVYCLGVKNALFKVSNEFEYENTIKPQLMGSNEETEFENIHQNCARKLVEGAVLYAEELGFPPHRDYKQAQKLFGDIDVNSCPVKYTYGKDGKPLYIRGPNESTSQAKQIVDKLSRKCGEGNFDYLLMPDDGINE